MRIDDKEASLFPRITTYCVTGVKETQHSSASMVRVRLFATSLGWRISCENGWDGRHGTLVERPGAGEKGSA
ncbi:hypothetical protein ASPCADRAFT_211453 [Aspergillus carbonarius ITEM 5010]|uniref:Uncharacterized protein n=1 Tax=Aspergillus carbonarius (strain ITEM 5010) TaxID=602072 RepID=A0A1R3R9L0_ASPC5|nr:hypothetical protein ASPCADRAFT_211453 [Aspergillus carbonarius ITEM 5010]